VKVNVVFNPVSGSGKSQAAAQLLAQQLDVAGHSATLAPTRRASDNRWLDDLFGGSGAAIVVGGDGTVRQTIGPASRTGVPLYHLPCGTENLFAREFGMEADTSAVIRSIEANRVRQIDLGRANGCDFALMCSVGFDAEVVRHLSLRRGARISHRSYVWPVIRQFLRWTPPVVTIEVDGSRIVNNGQGMIIVANSRQYAWRLDPVLCADMADGMLDVMFMPMRTRFDLIRWATRCARRRQMAHPRIVHTQGRCVRVQTHDCTTYQLDGDPSGEPANEASERVDRIPKNGSNFTDSDCPGLDLTIEVCPGALNILSPCTAR
jgi:diacylglycerol kinase family enzyme